MRGEGLFYCCNALTFLLVRSFLFSLPLLLCLGGSRRKKRKIAHFAKRCNRETSFKWSACHGRLEEEEKEKKSAGCCDGGGGLCSMQAGQERLLWQTHFASIPRMQPRRRRRGKKSAHLASQCVHKSTHPAEGFVRSQQVAKNGGGGEASPVCEKSRKSSLLSQYLFLQKQSERGQKRSFSKIANIFWNE